MRGEKRSPCPVACVLDLLGDRWTFLVIRDLVCGKSLFKEFCDSPEGIATNVLTDRLNRLVMHGLVETFPLPGQRGRDAYRLTAKGKTLRPILESLRDWGLAHLNGTEARMKPLSE